jgi:hypothetical protein
LEHSIHQSRKWLRGVPPLVLFSVALLIGMCRVGDTGPLWPDTPRYQNGAAMIHDWVAGGFLGSPVWHAGENYARYPAFSIPYHPPGYPAALAGWFLVFGESHFAARLFIALCWGGCGWIFFRLLRDFGTPAVDALLAGVLLLTTPQLAVWARDPMSEIPGFLPLFAAAFCWNRWLAGRGRGYGLAALALAETAFFFRVTTIGIVPGLLLFGLVSGQLPRRRWPLVVVSTLAYFALNIAWVKFAARYASHEVTADGKGQLSFRHIFEYMGECGPMIFPSATVALGVVGLLVSATATERRRPLAFWLCWFGSFLAFKALVITSMEPRHFVSALPAFAGLAGLLAIPPGGRASARRAVPLFLLGIAFNTWGIVEGFHAGIVGYEPAARAVATGGKPGNVLLACWEDQDWIFRYRCAKPTQDRYCLRADRTLAIRVSEYAKKEAEILGTTEDDVLKVIRDGRVAYVVTCAPTPDRPEVRTGEMKLVHDAMLHHPEFVRPVGEFPVTIDYAYWKHPFGGTATVWEVIGPVEAGPPNLKIVVPTAGMEWKP